MARGQVEGKKIKPKKSNYYHVRLRHYNTYSYYTHIARVIDYRNYYF